MKKVSLFLFLMTVLSINGVKAAECYYKANGQNVSSALEADFGVKESLFKKEGVLYNADYSGVDISNFDSLTFKQGNCKAFLNIAIVNNKITVYNNATEATNAGSASNSATNTNTNPNPSSQPQPSSNCSGLLGALSTNGDLVSTADYLQYMLDIIKYIGIAALIGLSIVDYAQAAAASDTDGLKKANKKVIKRLIYTVLLFVFPVILKFIFELTGIYGSNDPFCGLR